MHHEFTYDRLLTFTSQYTVYGLLHFVPYWHIVFSLLSFHFVVSTRLGVLIAIVSFPSVCFVECFGCLESS